jgi:hypothetical protein
MVELMKIRLPKKISLINAKKNIEKIFYLKFKNYKNYLKTFTKIDYIDLYNLHFIVTQNKRIKVIEFGSGISTFVFSDAMEKNFRYFKKMIIKKKKLNNYLDKKKKILFKLDNYFSVESFENSKRYFNFQKKILKKNKIMNVKLIKKNCKKTTLDEIIVFKYNHKGILNSDFIYIDGPGIQDLPNFDYKKSINPVHIDLLEIEFNLNPGTIVVVDGLPATIRFFKKKLLRNWKYYSLNNDKQTVMLLNEKSYGPINTSLLKYYENKS